MKVLILGATGYAGLPIAQAFVRAGHDVTGTTRSEKSVAKLEAEEMKAIVAATPQDWAYLVPSTDLIIDLSAAAGPEAAQEIIDVIAKGSEGRPPHLKPTFIYSSGGGVYGKSTDSEYKSERSGGFNPPPMVAWRLPIEQTVATHTAFHGIVIRPAIIYGRSMSHLSALFDKAYQASKADDNTFSWGVSQDTRWSIIHQDDLADLYVKIGEAAPLAWGLTFDCCQDHTVRAIDVFEALARASKTKFQSRAPSGFIEELYDESILIKPSLGAALTGWRARKPDLVDGMDMYYRAWVAGRRG